ncbi:hypothetical protein [Actinoalloteichus caeruleus]|uniref:hypothetical protein n=1 Tax=Actinoalloteichus cyanogriseus TaxID=2893586 RepID=UPI003BB98535
MTPQLLQQSLRPKLSVKATGAVETLSQQSQCGSVQASGAGEARSEFLGGFLVVRLVSHRLVRWAEEFVHGSFEECLQQATGGGAERSQGASVGPASTGQALDVADAQCGVDAVFPGEAFGFLAELLRGLPALADQLTHDGSTRAGDSVHRAACLSGSGDQR